MLKSGEMFSAIHKNIHFLDIFTKKINILFLYGQKIAKQDYTQQMF